MPITPIAPERIAEAQAVLREQMRVATPTNEVLNATVAADLSMHAVLQFRRRTFDVPPVPFRAGIELQAIATRYDAITQNPALSPEPDAEQIALCQDAVYIYWQLVRPTTPVGRLLWRWRTNPFGNATLGEVAELLGFFLRCRMRSSVRVLPSGLGRVRYTFRSTPSTTFSGSRRLSLVT